MDKLMMTRREALAALGALALAGEAALAAEKKKGRGKRKKAQGGAAAQGGIALQLYTMREPAKKDLAGTLKQCREMGWEYVQWSGMPNLKAEEIRKALDDAGLKAISAHTGIEPFEKDFEKEVQFWKTVGIKDIAPGGMMSDCTANLEAWLKGAKRLDAVGAKLREAGIRLSYHNHNKEFEKFPEDPRTKLDILYESTSPQNLYAELDVAWIYAAGVDPAAYVRKYKGRCPVIHVKDGKKNGNKMAFTPLGQGELKWPELFAAAKESDVEWYVYEQDNGVGSPFDWAKASYEFLKANVK